MRFGDPRVQALTGALTVTRYALTGSTNRRLRALMVRTARRRLHPLRDLLR
jgi:hypothetical protein